MKTEQTKKMRINIQLIIILAIGFFLRLFNLTAKPIWYDEACSISFASNTLNSFLSHRYLIKPVYFILLRGWVLLFGSGAFAARSLSVLFGVLSVMVIYRLGKLLFNKTIGLISAFLLAVSVFHINYSQQARNYSLFGLLGLISMLIFARLLKKNKKQDWFLYIISNLLLVFTHPFGVLIVLSQTVYLLYVFLRTKKKFSMFWICQIVIVIFFTALTLLVFKQNFKTNTADFKHMPDRKENLIIETYETFCFGGKRPKHGGLGSPISDNRLFLPRLISVIYIILFVLGVTFDRQKKKPGYKLDKNQATLLMLVWLGFSVLSGYLIPKSIMPSFLIRYLYATTPAFYILAAKGLAHPGLRNYRKASVFSLLALSFFSLRLLYFPEEKGYWNDAAYKVKEKIQQHDSILFYPLEQIVPFWYYYKDQDRLPLQNIDKYGRFVDGKWLSSFTDETNNIFGISLDAEQPELGFQISEIIGQKNDLWIIASPGSIGKQKMSYLINSLEKSHYLAEEYYFQRENVKVYRYRPGHNPDKT
jgi:uncharacterized membrane protein